MLEQVRARGVRTAEVTLHVGLGTFAPVKAERIEEHRMHYERFDVPAGTAALVNSTKQAKGRIFAIGTTSVRVLESASSPEGELKAGSGKTNIFIHPPYRFKVVDALLTNFHLPESTLLMLVSALAGRELILETYAAAVREHYRFFSYGDAMLIL
jgi:S-adenosylmethionine:tRNA ribosyltransferase-isomerase